jgi:2-keto-3-deoxy-L-rhamnonate aldolase RhmA
MRENRLRTLLREGKPSLGTRLNSPVPNIVEIIGASGKYDYVEFVAEYTPYSLHDLDNIGRAVDLFPNFSGMIKMERSAQWHLAVRAFSAGIQNMLFTDVRTADDAREVVTMVRPETPDGGGTHGQAGGRALRGSGMSDVAQAYKDAVIVLMIEKKGAVENIEAICEVPGIDMIQFGPSDYSMSVGLFGGAYGTRQLHPEVLEARTHVNKVALKKGVQPRAEISDPSEAEQYLEYGVRHFCMAPDTAILAMYYGKQGGAMREMLDSAK